MEMPYMKNGSISTKVSDLRKDFNSGLNYFKKIANTEITKDGVLDYAKKGIAIALITAALSGCAAGKYDGSSRVDTLDKKVAESVQEPRAGGGAGGGGAGGGGAGGGGGGGG